MIPTPGIYSVAIPLGKKLTIHYLVFLDRTSNMKIKYRTVINIKNMKILQGEGNVMSKSKNAHGTCTEHMNTYQKNITTDFKRTPTE